LDLFQLYFLAVKRSNSFMKKYYFFMDKWGRRERHPISPIKKGKMVVLSTPIRGFSLEKQISSVISTGERRLFTRKSVRDVAQRLIAMRAASLQPTSLISERTSKKMGKAEKKAAARAKALAKAQDPLFARGNRTDAVTGKKRPGFHDKDGTFQHVILTNSIPGGAIFEHTQAFGEAPKPIRHSVNRYDRRNRRSQQARKDLRRKIRSVVPFPDNPLMDYDQILSYLVDAEEEGDTGSVFSLNLADA
jgi:hypothetical protein